MGKLFWPENNRRLLYLNHMIPRSYRYYVSYKLLKDRWREVFLSPFEDFKTA